MSIPVSAPVVPPQPNLPAYGFQELALFRSYTRESYRAAFGIEAPPWDPSRLKKTWFDSTADRSDPSNVSVYKFFGRDAAGNWAIRQLVVPAQEAATVNLPGTQVYPPYVVAPTQATRGGAPVNPIYLSLESEARALMAELGGQGLIDEGNTSVFPIVYPAEEPRRAWNILFQGHAENAGALLFNRNAKGIGAPGHWDSSSQTPVWMPAPAPPSGLDDTRLPREMPVRDLFANEKLQTGLMGVSVVRIDLEQQSNEQSGQFTPDDRALLRQIFQIVNRLG
jgi:hypothetical protein